MSDRLSKTLWVEQTGKPFSPEDRVVKALQRALDSTTPERPGVPWDDEEKPLERGVIIPGDE